MKCEICGYELDCPQAAQHPSVQKQCLEQKGELWAQVVDDEWRNLKHVPVEASEHTAETTDAGFAVFQRLELKTYTVGPKLDAELLKKYDPPAFKTTNVHVTSAGELKYACFVLPRKARVTVQVVKKGDAKQRFNDAEVSLTFKEGAQDTTQKMTAGEGEAAFEERSAGQYEFTVVLSNEDKKRYATPEAPLTFTLAPGEDKVVAYELIPLATPRVKVVDQVSKREIEGISVKLTAKKDSTEHALDKTRPSGITDFTKDQPGLVPGDYAIAIAAAGYMPVLMSADTITLAEGDTQTFVVEVSLPKGAVRILINRYDGQALKERVKLKIAKTSDLGAPVSEPTTAEREVEVERPGSRKVKVKEDWKEVGDLDPGDYQVEIVDLDAKVLKNQEASETWRIGPDSTGKVTLKVEAGKTAEVRFTVSRYTKVRFIGYNVMPGYTEGLRCHKCSAQNPKTSTGCGTCGATLYKHCAGCGNYFPSATANCPTCAVVSNVSGPYHWCATCADWADPTTCGGPPPHVLQLRYQHTNWDCGHVYPSMSNSPSPCTYGCKRSLPFDQQYLGLPNNQEDLLARCLLMKAAISTAYAEEKDNKPEELKVFMAPEFFFRGVDGAYPVDDLHLIMSSMREETQDAKYKDWLFVYGTAIGQIPQAPSESTQFALKVAEAATNSTVIKVTHGGKDKAGCCASIPAENALLPLVAQWRAKLSGKTSSEKVVLAVTQLDADVYQLTLPAAVSVDKDDPCVLHGPLAAEILNYALIQRGGPDDVAGLREGLVYKEKISHIDFLRNRSNHWGAPGQRNIYVSDKDVIALPTEGADESLSRKKNPVSGEVTSTGLGGGSIFTMDGITFGLEVCLDHLTGRMSKYFNAPPAGAAKVQVQLVPSWGASITPSSLCGMLGALVFNVDGPQGSDACTIVDASPSTDTDLPSAKATRLPAPASHAVPQPAKATVTFKDSTQSPPQDKTVTDLDPKYDLLIEKHPHQVNRAGVTGAADYAWVDLYAAQALPEAETY
ncbi:MSCRAMM family protein [Corallococcus macrosporus]|uniref:Uncharacterized protein n=1 Tax=Corallococcus macrosporus DSM 14697 TaxID=1189310 RepID=A0A250JVS1_9BACT|nr:hypothetical protein [Corallococcus macrosporus]ATB47945.1 hypothetical protein MYMAC_003568 [Corallococcus macrosporus DSM 14697]